MSTFYYLWLWFASVVAAGVIGYARQLPLAGAILGFFLGPLGVLAALALDGRASCPHCAGRLDGRGHICQHCHRPVRWDDAPSESSILPYGWFRLGRDSLSCPHCSAALQEQVAACPRCSGSITWARGVPLKVSRHDEPEAPPVRQTEQPWSQFRGMR